jgi:hypothetical protein
MNQKQATFAAIMVSIITALGGGLMIALFWIGFGMFPFGNLEQICIAVLRLDGVLFGFVLAVFAFSFERIKTEERDWGYVVLISTFISLLGSILFAFLGLLSVDRWPLLSVISISLTLGAIVNMIFWIQDLGFPHKNHKP